MDGDSIATMFWLGIGSFLIAIGGTTTTLSAFDGDIIPAYAGILLFMAGYKVSWYGTKLERRTQLEEVIAELNDPTVLALARSLFMLVVGGAGIAYGIVLFARSVVTASLALGGIAGVISFGGYITAHTQLQKELL